jgi:hypothetical protein
LADPFANIHHRSTRTFGTALIFLGLPVHSTADYDRELAAANDWMPTPTLGTT